MRSVGVALAIVLIAHGRSTAQSLNGVLFPAAVTAPPVQAAVVESAPPPRPAAVSNLLLERDRRDDPAQAAAQLFERLPLDRLQKKLVSNRPLRMIGTVVGATLISAQFHQTNTSALAQIGVQAIRFGGSEWLESARFRVEPQVRPRGFAISIRQIQH
jgi:hypothetical protein